MVYDLLGQCLNEIIVHEKRALRLLNFTQAGDHAIYTFLPKMKTATARIAIPG